VLDVCTGIALFIIETHKNTITKTSKKIVLVFFYAPGPSVFVPSFALRWMEEKAAAFFYLLFSSSVILSVSTLYSITENE